MILGSKNPEHIKENFDLFDFALTEEEMKKIGGLNKNVSTDEKYIVEDGELDLDKFTPITYDPVYHGYYRLGERVGNAFKDGA